jgi:hypothetical protein
MAEPDHESVTAMSLGLALEDYLLPRIEAGLSLQGWSLERDVRVVLYPTQDGKVAGTTYTPKEWESTGVQQFNPQRMIKGHLDAVLRKDDMVAVVDTKTKAWGRKYALGEGWVYSNAAGFRDSHLVQIGSYLLGFDGARYGAICEFNKAHCEMRTGWFELDSVREIVTQRFYEVLARTNPDNPEPEIGPLEWTKTKTGDSWACGYLVPISKGPAAGTMVPKKAYCPYLECPNHVTQRIKALRDLKPGDEVIGGNVRSD